MLKKITILSLIILASSTLVYADAGGAGAGRDSGYKLLAPVGDTAFVAPDTFNLYLQQIINISIGIAGALSVIILIIGGLQYVFSSVSESAKKDAKDRITNAITGLLIALSGYLLLNTINPDLIKLGLPKIDKLSPPTKTGSPIDRGSNNDQGGPPTPGSLPPTRVGPPVGSHPLQ